MSLSFALGYIKYYFKASGRHSIHSPFIYALAEAVRKKNNNPATQKIELVRKQRLKEHILIPVEDFGAGSGGMIRKERKISEITHHSSKPVHYCRLLYNIVKHFKPMEVLELGTGAGISSMYMAAANPLASITSLEGSKSIADMALENVHRSGITGITIINEPFETGLPRFLKNCGLIDLVFLDGNHRKEPTIHYFRLCLQKAHKYTVFIIDDINWSDEMKEAWKEIKSHEKVTASISFYTMGLVFLNPELSKEEFTIRY